MLLIYYVNRPRWFLARIRHGNPFLIQIPVLPCVKGRWGPMGALQSCFRPLQWAAFLNSFIFSAEQRTWFIRKSKNSIAPAVIFL